MPQDRALDVEDEPTTGAPGSTTEPTGSQDRAPPALPSRPPHHRLAGMLGVLVLVVVSVGVGVWQSASLRPLLTHLNAAEPAHPRFGREAPPPLAAADPAPSSARSGHRPNLAVQADNAARELAGSGDRSYLSWNPQTGLWKWTSQPLQVQATVWANASWQSAQALRALVRYLQQTADTQRAYQDLIARTYLATVQETRHGATNAPASTGASSAPGATPSVRQALWWGLAWAQAARYELYDHHDRAAAARYLAAAQRDAVTVAAQPSACIGAGVSLRAAGPPRTLASAAFIQLAAQIGALRARGRLSVPGQGRRWLQDAEQTLATLRFSGMVDTATGQTTAGLTADCRPAGPASPATQGMLAEALVTLGAATRNAGYLDWAASLINYALMPTAGMVGRSVLQEPCEGQQGLCADRPGSYALGADKGLLTDAIADWTRATGSSTYTGFLVDQAHAVLTNAAGNGRSPSRCQSPTACQIGFYWSRRPEAAVTQLAPTPASQAAGLAALSDALSVEGTTAG